MKVDLDDLESKARAATPGNWTAVRPPDSEDGWATGMMVAAVAPRQLVYSDHSGGVAPEANRHHIAANGPTVTLALIEYIRALEEQARRTIEATGLTVEDEIAALDALVGKGAVLP